MASHDPWPCLYVLELRRAVARQPSLSCKVSECRALVDAERNVVRPIQQCDYRLCCRHSHPLLAHGGSDLVSQR